MNSERLYILTDFCIVTVECGNQKLMASGSVWLLSLIVCWGLPSPHTTLSYAAVYYVTPHSPSPDCPSGAPCFTINEYALGNHFDGDDHVTLLFLNGEHNLTAQNFQLDHKTLFKMSLSHAYTGVVIQLLNQTSIAVSNLVEVEFTGLKFVSPNDDQDSGIFFLDIDYLVVTKISTESCQLSLQGKMNANISELMVSKTLIHLFLMSHKNQVVALRNSEFHFSTLSVSDSLTSQLLVGDTMCALSLESSLMNSSLVAVTLQTQIVYQLSVLNTVIQSTNSLRDHDITLDTGVKADVHITKLFSLFRNCSIIGNDHGINITVGGSTRMELSVDQCFIANNGHRLAHQGSGGVEVHVPPADEQSKGVTIVNITDSTLSGNNNAQFAANRYSLTTSVSVFNSTFEIHITKYCHIHVTILKLEVEYTSLQITQTIVTY